MQGGYLQWSDIGKREEEIKPYPYYTDGVMYSSGFSSQNPVTWWILKQYGIRILGPDPKDLDIQINEKILVEYVHHNMNTYWTSRLEQIEKIVCTINTSGNVIGKEMDWEIEWSVLGVLRQFYTIKERDITSKVRAGTYALNELPKQWHRIIQEAISIRKGLNIRHYESDRERLNDTVKFLKYLIDSCNKLMN
jgi:hypothetical protein